MTAVQRRASTLALTPRGELCEDTIDGFEALLAAAPPDVVIDLRDVTIFSAAAMRAVAAARRRGTSERLVNPSPLTVRALDAVGLPTG